MSEPKVRQLPDEPGPEVTAVRDCVGRLWRRLDADPEPWRLVREHPVRHHATWYGLLAYAPLTDATPDGPQPDPKRTPEAAAEILARELYIVGHITADDRTAREGWYRLASDGARDGWRDDARRLLASLRESDLALTWLTDATPAADGQDGRDG
jgi:hypothetical protein